ncbi:MAG: GTPase domain-containing protein, partial [Planctomycetota bacterium]
MKTLLSQFCDEFEAVVRPVLDPLADFVEVLDGVGGRDGQGRAIASLADFQEASHQLQVLAEKVAEQQAYVLIFGPLKSGKSTLMNAIGASYVSEVTSLPAYPCMVYVSHSPTREFVVTRYTGDRQSFGAPASMRMQVNRDHAELAERIRAEEQRERDFDPAQHFPEAIRRIDVRVPAEALGDSGAVLVDTPGLYSKMKFGYDQMTREFRNAAACAIFVVKTDNLFLEQVFEEFQSLLELFSRIFLVVNVDTTKMDLRPDGSLAPSLEREDPVRVIEAFETLAMSASLKRAVEEKRLRIYPVDLLRAASSRLQQSLAGDRSEPAEDYAGREDFEGFLSDLTSYLNSSDYLVAFLADSLRHGQQLLERIDGLTRDDGVESLARRASALRLESDDLEARAADLGRLTNFEWEDAFAGLGAHLVERNRADASSLWSRVVKRIDHAVDAWFEGDDSVADLLEGDVADEVGAFQREYALLVEQSLRERVAGDTAGAELPEELAAAAHRSSLRLGDFASSGLVAVLPKYVAQPFTTDLDLEHLPVRRGFFDLLLFRRVKGIRRQLLGSLERPTRSIARGEKARRLGERGRDWLHEQLHARVDGALQEVTEALADGIARDYRASISAALVDELNRARGRVQRRLDEVREELDQLGQLAEQLERLRIRVDDASSSMADLSRRYA